MKFSSRLTAWEISIRLGKAEQKIALDIFTDNQHYRIKKRGL